MFQSDVLEHHKLFTLLKHFSSQICTNVKQKLTATNNQPILFLHIKYTQKNLQPK